MSTIKKTTTASNTTQDRRAFWRMTQALLLAAAFACTAGNASADTVRLASLPGGADALPPIGWVQFCQDYRNDERAPCSGPVLPARDAVLDEKNWKELVRINAQVNREIDPVTDLEHWGVPEHWDYPDDKRGDCEDYVIEKRDRLLKAGWPRQALLITVVRDRRGDGHAVLTVKTDRGDMILDNQVNKILPWSETGYKYIKRQSQENPNRWVSLGNVDSQIYTSQR